MGDKRGSNKTIICLPYDINQIYAFWCARYENISFEKFLDIGITELKSRVINIGKIKDKDEKKYWREQKRINKIPDIYLSSKELDEQLKEAMKNSSYLGGK